MIKQGKVVATLFFVVAAMSLAGCHGGLQVASEPGEKPIWVSAKERPSWTVDDCKPKDSSDEDLWFVGVSNKAGFEQEAKTNAMTDAAGYVSRYIGTVVSNSSSKVTASHGVSRDPVISKNMAAATNEISEENIVRLLKPHQWYFEKWQPKKENTYLLAWVCTSASKDSLNKLLNDVIDIQIEKLRTQSKNADDVSKANIENGITALQNAKLDDYFSFKEKK